MRDVPALVAPAPARCKRWLLAGGLAAFGMAGACQAQGTQNAPNAQNVFLQPGRSTWFAVSNQALDRLRGGFDAGAGLRVSFGISRAVSLNGQMVTSTSFFVDDIGRLTPAQAQALGQQPLLQTQVVQNGPGNTVATGAMGAMGAPLAIYVQNTLANQTIRSETAIHAASSGLSLVKNLNLQATLNESIHNAIRNR